MVRHVLAISLAVGATLRGPSCGDVDSPTSGIHAPCTRDRDCNSGLVCTEGVCVPEDAGASDASAVDASSSDAVSDAPSDAGDG